jgi:hypothetical protein
MGMTVFICIIAFSIIWPVEMLVLKACSGDVRVARCIMEQKGSECLNRTSGKIQPEFRTPSSEFRIPNPGTLNLQPETLNFLLRQAVKTWATFYTAGLNMAPCRDTFDTCGLIMAPQKNQ